MGIRQKLGATLGVVSVAGLLAAGIVSPAVAAKAPRCGDRKSSNARRGDISTVRRDLVGPRTYTVKKAGVAYRTGPGTRYRRLGTLRKGGILAATGYTSGGWTQFYLTVGGTAWVVSGYLAGARYPVYRVAAVPGVNLRSGPGLNYRIIGALKNGVIVPGTGRNVNGWLQLQLVNGVLPWASSRYLQLLPAAETYGSPAEPNEDGPIDPPVGSQHCWFDDDYSW